MSMLKKMWHNFQTIKKHKFTNIVLYFFFMSPIIVFDSEVFDSLSMTVCCFFLVCSMLTQKKAVD